MGVEEAVLDTDLLSEILKGRNAAVESRKARYLVHHRRLTLTSVSVMEILAGLRHKSAPVQLAQAETLFRDNREILPSADDYRLASEIIGDLYTRGRPIGVSDPLIAACALNRNLVLAMGNARHFGYVQAAGYPLRLEDWREP